MVRLEFIVGAVAGVVIGCGVNQTFACQSSADCRSSAADGTCEATGFCSFPDGDCPSGSRYAEYAGGGLASTCVDETAGGSSGNADASSGRDTSAATGSDSANPTATSTSTSTSGGTNDGDGSGDTGAAPLTVTFGERVDADHQGVTADTFIAEAAPQGNAGSHLDLHLCGDSAFVQIALIRFDLTALRPGTDVASAEIEMYGGGDNSGDDTFDSFVLLESWDEGDLDFEVGVANYVERKPGVPWSVEGAGPPTSRESFSLGQTDPPFDPGVPLYVSIPANIVQTWIDDPSTNHGIAMTALDPFCDAVLLSSDHIEQARRPLLRVTLRPSTD